VSLSRALGAEARAGPDAALPLAPTLLELRLRTGPERLAEEDRLLGPPELAGPAALLADGRDAELDRLRGAGRHAEPLRLSERPVGREVGLDVGLDVGREEGREPEPLAIFSDDCRDLLDDADRLSSSERRLLGAFLETTYQSTIRHMRKVCTEL